MTRRLLSLSLSLVLALSLAACGGGVSQAEYDKLKRDYEQLLDDYNALKGGGTASPSPSGGTLPTDNGNPSNPFDWGDTDPTPDDAVITFPDPAFEAAVRKVSNTPIGDITKADVARLTSLDVSGTSEVRGSIRDMTGIEHFTALTTLYCYYNQITVLDVSRNTALTVLYCNDNQLSTLDVSRNTALTTLICSDNWLSTLDVSRLAALTGLACYNNQLTSLDVSRLTALTQLACGGNRLTTLDVTHNTALTELYCSDNQLTALDVSGLTALKFFDCRNNYFPNKSAIIGLGESKIDRFIFDPPRTP
ncbi:MAG: leucine-rich repeat domain-containing protein [Oscillospiraceae bacterium]|jgi:Leucine-rich repeat (LRR) protein|nr:leucine-rich repeat domain-containing protein [Oscillospiraceae bacterium]